MGYSIKLTSTRLKLIRSRPLVDFGKKTDKLKLKKCNYKYDNYIRNPVGRSFGRWLWVAWKIMKSERSSWCSHFSNRRINNDYCLVGYDGPWSLRGVYELFGEGVSSIFGVQAYSSTLKMVAPRSSKTLPPIYHTTKSHATSWKIAVSGPYEATEFFQFT
jgi:hypothetical protein